MDVLELPRPVINFLRTMAKESGRYALSWDIFGGPDSVTLTLTWKLIDDESQSSLTNDAPSSLSTIKQPNYDEPSSNRPRSTGKSHTSSSSPRRSRRDENTHINENATVPAIFRSSRGKSLEGSSIPSNKQGTCHQPHLKEHQHLSSLERPTVANHYHHRSKKEPPKSVPTQSDQVYGNLYDTRSTAVVKYATVSSLSSSSPSPQPSNTTNTNDNPPLSVAHVYHQRAKQQQQQSITPPTVRKPIRSSASRPRTPTVPIPANPSSTYTKLKRINHIATPDEDDDDDDDDDALDPWVKRFECSLQDNNDDTTDQSEEKALLPSNPTTETPDESGNTSGKVKFKTKPDYF